MPVSARQAGMGLISIEPFGEAMVAEGARVMAAAFAANPLHVAAFGADVLARNEAFFRAAFPAMKGTKLAAFDGGRMVGFVHWVDAPGCQLSRTERLRLMPGVVGGLGLRCTVQVLSWLSAWSAEDPPAAHVHLGPIGVLPEAQGRGVGRLLMSRYCQALDDRRRAGYLETDRPANVAFYRRFEFETVREVTVIGVTSYLMERPALTV